MTDAIGVDLTSLAKWLRATRPELVGAGGLSGQRLQGGLSNLTYRIDGGLRPFVLRRPPLGHVLPTAHDMSREFRVISGLARSNVPVPEAILFEDDRNNLAGVGTSFYLMEFVSGIVLAHPSANKPFKAHQLRNLSFELVEVLTWLHDADATVLGLAELGRSEGFLVRQLQRWATQAGQSASRELPDLERLRVALIAHIPSTRLTSLIHGDYRLDNAIVQTAPDGNLHIAAILDWEMATIGDSLTDLGLLGLYWNIRDISPGAEISTNTAIDPNAGYPTFEELVNKYASLRGVEVGNIGWYVAFASFKLAVILEGIHYRYTLGKTVGPGFDRIGESVEPLARFGLDALTSDFTLDSRKGR
jgi:aminoglycoside phosphotransferase (APT) family kinase protein